MIFWWEICLFVPQFYWDIIDTPLVALAVKDPPASAGDTRDKDSILVLGRWEDPLEEGTATHSSILAWRIPMDRGTWQAVAHRVAKSWTWLKRLSTAHGVSLRWQHDGLTYIHHNIITTINLVHVHHLLEKFDFNSVPLCVMCLYFWFWYVCLL